MKATIIKVYDKTKLIFVVVLRLIIEVRIRVYMRERIGIQQLLEKLLGRPS